MHYSLKKLRHSTYASWARVFNDPDDPRWVIVKDHYGNHGIQHNCDDSFTGNDYHTNIDGCVYCGEEPPESLVGFLNLVEWHP